MSVAESTRIYVHNGRVWVPDRNETKLYGALYGLPEYWYDRAAQADREDKEDLAELFRKHAANCR